MNAAARDTPPASDEQGRSLRWLFAGQGVMGAAALESLVIRLPPLAVFAAEPVWGERPLAATAEARGLDLHHVARIGPDPARDWPGLFGDLDVAVCCCWGELLQPGALETPARGWLNLHPAALPLWRGADPVGWQLLTGPSHIGCSVHRMTTGQDDGPILADGSVPVHAGDDRAALLRRSGAELGRLAADVLVGLARGHPPPERPQAHENATWCPPPGTVPMIDPRQLPAATAARLARAFSPWPGVAIATMPAQERFVVTEVGEELAADDAPGAVATERPARRAASTTSEPSHAPVGAHGEGEAVALACRDRWLRGRVRTLPAGGPDTAGTGRPDTAGTGPRSSRRHGAVPLPLRDPDARPD